MYHIPGPEVAGASVLQDLRDMPDISLHAFQAFRSVMMWAQEREREDGDPDALFLREGMCKWLDDMSGGKTAIRDDLRAFLAAIVAELLATPPDAVLMARACLSVTEWGLTHNHIPTALAFSEAAAWAVPTARYAFLAGKLHRQYGRHNPAECFFKMAEERARAERDWETRARVVLARGSVDWVRGRFAPARETFQKALKMCALHRLEGGILGEVHHDLLAVTIAQKDYVAAQRHAEAAVAAYPRDHPRLPFLAHDMAVLWMETGDHANALSVLIPLLDRHFTGEPISRMMVCGNSVRAAGGCGQRKTYDRVVVEMESVLQRAGGATVRHAPALLEAARGALLMEDWARADRWVARARQLAEQMQQEEVLADADQLKAGTRQAPGAVASARTSRNRKVAAKTVEALAGSAN